MEFTSEAPKSQFDLLSMVCHCIVILLNNYFYSNINIEYNDSSKFASKIFYLNILCLLDRKVVGRAMMAETIDHDQAEYNSFTLYNWVHWSQGSWLPTI